MWAIRFDLFIYLGGGGGGGGGKEEEEGERRGF